MTPAAQTFDDIVQARRSVRVYDTAAPYDPAVVARSLDRAMLAPNSSNLQTWSFHRIRSEAAKAEAARLCLGQSAARTAHELVAFVARPDRWRDHSRRVLAQMQTTFADPPTKRDRRAVTYYRRNIPLLYTHDPLGLMTLVRRAIVWFKRLQGPFVGWASRADQRVILHKSVALAAQTFMLGIKAEGYDTCPMEGFDEGRMKRLLGLPRQAEITMVVAVGVAAPGGVYSPRFRFGREETVYEV